VSLISQRASEDASERGHFGRPAHEGWCKSTRAGIWILVNSTAQDSRWKLYIGADAPNFAHVSIKELDRLRFRAPNGKHFGKSERRLLIEWVES